MLNIVIPMAGRGSRFADVGYSQPKPLIEIHNVPMIKLVIDNLRPKVEHRFIFICQESHLHEHNLVSKLNQWAEGCEILTTPGITEGAACTVLLAEKLINNESPLMIANSDQWIDIEINDYLDNIQRKSLQGLIMTMEANDPKWSFVKLDNNRLVTEVVEKKVVSNEATVGIYNFAKGADFCWAASRMIEKELRVNGEYYVAPAYNELIDKGSKVGICNIGRVDNGMYGLGTPDDFERFLNTEISIKAVNSIGI